MKLKFLLLILAVLMLKNLPAQISILENGDQVAWDGQYYDFRDAEGVKMIKLMSSPMRKKHRSVLFAIYLFGGT